MPGPVWDHDDPADTQRVIDNVDRLVWSLKGQAADREVPSLAVVRRWHAACFAGCTLPVPGYAGRFRGDSTVPELIGYEVGVGALRADGMPDRVGVPSADVRAGVLRLLAQIRRAVGVLDPQVPAGHRPIAQAELETVASLAAAVHGEWIRIHPYANGNGRTARLWGAWVALRYGLPVFVTVKPRPADADYAISSRMSMGRPPDFQGDHRAAGLVFADMLARVVNGR
jgi:hypothetical protein